MKRRLIKTVALSVALYFVLEGVANNWNALIMLLIFIIALLLGEWYFEKN